ncbi:BatA domain-containing protein [Marilutibacter maris]|uniref:Membrane protein n=1 Tax=Marilutibacter maris TaxID=1605891 RepID=A0A2U9T550_9GAMM|nr:BatA domain-containing protein [Lysobacter maris]AWV07886.1 membrane protein [Lysobacter maris]
MSFALLLPAALVALTALLLPLLIHLARRSEQRPTEFAALRWLRQRPRPRQRIRFEEWPLLLLRLALLALVALWLARPVLYGEAAGTPWTVVVAGVDPASLPAAGDRDVEVRWLAPGFPDIAQPAPHGPVPFASLLRQLDAELPADIALTVRVPERLEHADAQLPVLSRKVDWQVVPGAMPQPPIAATAPPLLHVVASDPAPPALRYLRAATHAWWPDPDAASAAVTLSTPAGSAPADAVLVWLEPGELPPAARAWIADGGTALLAAAVSLSDPPAMVAAWRDADGTLLAEATMLGRGRVVRLTRPLSPASMPVLLEPGFPARLRALLQPPPAPARAPARAHAPATGADAYPQPPRDLQPWWALLIALVWLAERWLATSRRRGART